MNPATVRRRLLRATRHLRIQVTAAATLAAVVLAVAGAIVFVALFHRSLVASTDNALLTASGQLTADLSAAPGDPALAPANPSTRTTVVALYDASGTLRQTVTSSRQAAQPADVVRASDVRAARTGPVRLTRAGTRVVLAPVARPDGTWVLLVGTGLEQVDDAARDAEDAFVVAVPVVVALIAAGTWLLSGAVLRPVRRMRLDAADLRGRVAAGGVDVTAGSQVRVPRSGDEIEALARTFNALLVDLAAASDRQRALIADAGHELRTPLTVLRTELELADRPSRSRADLLDSIRHAATEVDRLTALANDMLLLADAERRAAASTRPTDLGAVVADAVRAHRGLAESRGARVSAAVVGDATVRVDRDAYRRAVDNLLVNAVGVGASHVVVTVSGDERTVRTVVDDDGPGFEPGLLLAAFDRFTRGDASRHRTGVGGSGLGLAVVAAVARAHGGTAAAENTADGARVTIVLPRAD